MNRDLLIEAAEWFDAKEELTPAQQQAFESWLAESPEQRQAYDQIAKYFGVNAELDVALLAASERDTQAINPFTASAHKKSQRHRSIKPGFSGLLSRLFSSQRASLVSVLVLGFYFSGVFYHYLSKPQAIIEATPSLAFESESAVGERRFISLKDGSQLYLNADSKVKVVFDDLRRKVILLEGEVYFDIAKDPNRPFIVEAGEVDIRVVGTAFNVDRRDSQVNIDVTEGVVRSEADRVVELTAGQAISASEYGFDEVRESRYELSADWRNGWIEADSLLLSELVFKLQKYSQAELVVDPALDDLVISGRFNLDNPSDTLAIIAPLYDLSIENSGDKIYLDGHTAPR